MKICRTKNQFLVNFNKLKINWMETHEIILDKSQPNIIKMKRKIGDDFQTVDIAKGNTDNIDFERVELEQLWPNGRPLSVAKLNDLREMMELVPDKYKYFYQLLEVVPSQDFVDDADGFGGAIDFEPE